MTATPDNAAPDPQQIIAELQRKLDERTAERNESIAQQAATADILKVINASKGDPAPVFDIILEKAHSLCDVAIGSLQLYDGDHMRAVAVRGMTVAFEEFLRHGYRVTDRLRQGFNPDRAVHSADLTQVLARMPDLAVIRAAVELGGIRTALTIPLVKDGAVLGRVVAARQEVRPFSDHQIALLQNFADQAVIAIENARLFNETTEALERQTATANILKVIAGSPTDVQPVFDAIAESAKRLLASHTAVVTRVIDDVVHLAASTAESEAPAHAAKGLLPYPLSSDRIHARVARTGQVAVNTDAPNSDLPQEIKEFARTVGWRSMLVVPMLRNEIAIGTIGITRREPGSFDDKAVDLLKTFADQAVIAIENARLFNETKEALARQTATSDVLKVIASSPSNLQPVFDAIAERSNELMSGHATTVFRFIGETAELAAFTSVSTEADAVLRAAFPRPISTARDFVQVSRGQIAEIIDAAADTEPETSRNIARARGFRSRLVVPLKSDSSIIGAISITRRQPGAFAPQDVELLRTFADQAVIAIQNVELFEEVQAKTRDLEESLQQQTATADVLKVISRSAFDLQSVFDTLTASATQLCEADYGIIFLRKEDTFYAHATSGARPAVLDFLKANPRRLSDKSMVPRVARTGAVVHIPDRLLDPDYEFVGVDQALGSVARTMLGVPLLRNGTAEGVFVLGRYEPKPFTQRQIELIESFSDQAVIAIENVRLFDEVQARTKELAASLDDLRNAQDRLIQTEKLASLGQLTAGIAHEIKNPLNFVNNFSTLSAELIEEMKDVLSDIQIDNSKRSELEEIAQTLKSNLEKVVQHGKRADSIVKNMLLHSREGSGEHRSADINAIVDESLNLAYHGARAEKAGFSIAFQRDLDPSVGMVDVYPQEITRVLLNLISNGFYAATKRKAEIGDGFEPMLSATTKNLGDKVEIRIRDNGTGIPEEVKEKIFNPFFTTKPSGEGTGLGLSMSHDIIVKQHGGSIDVATEPGVFTEFKIVLPRATQT